MGGMLAVTRRILQQFRHDPRTVFMMIIAPIIALTILSIIFGSPDYEPLVLQEGLTAEQVAALEDGGARVEAATEAEARDRLESADADGFVQITDGRIEVLVEGTDPNKTAAVMLAVRDLVAQLAEESAADAAENLARAARAAAAAGAAAGAGSATATGSANATGSPAATGPAPAPSPPSLDDIVPPEPVVTYVHGSEDMRTVDFFGPVFIGVFVFFFVFITSGISFVRERTGGTLERLMATPIRRSQLVFGYVLGFGVFSLLQTVIVAWASIEWVGFPNEGSFLLVLLIAESMALVSLTLGILVSEFANTELQVVQLLQILVVPQILLSGMFDLSQTPAWMQLLSRLFPVTYGAEAMRAVMLRGAGFGDIVQDLAVLWAFIAVFVTANVLTLKKYRSV